MGSLLDPTILCFLIGLLAGFCKSDLKLPASTYEFVSMYLLLAIGLKGGAEMAKTGFSAFLPAVGATLLLGILVPVIAYMILKASKKFSREDSGAIAAHYGSVSAVTFATAISFLEAQKVPYESYVTTLMVILEIPAICVGIYLAKGGFNGVLSKRELACDVLFGKSLFLLGGGLVVGFVADGQKMNDIEPLFVDLFKGFLAFFLLEMGVKASQQMSCLRKTGVFLFGFAIVMPLISGMIGVLLGYLIGMSPGGVFILAILAASSSYIAAPSAIKIAVPSANPTLSLTSSLAITFPFNIVVGIPLFFMIIGKLF